MSSPSQAFFATQNDVFYTNVEVQVGSLGRSYRLTTPSSRETLHGHSRVVKHKHVSIPIWESPLPRGSHTDDTIYPDDDDRRCLVSGPIWLVGQFAARVISQSADEAELFNV